MKKIRISFFKQLLMIIVLASLPTLYASITAKKKQVISTRLESEIFLLVPSVEIDNIPTIDGNDKDPAWASIPKFIVTIKQGKEKIKIVIKAIKTDDRIFFLIKAPLKSFVKKHKLWHWNKAQHIYVPGYEKETSLALLFFKDAKLADSADVWIWRAARNNIAGFADDMSLKDGAYTMDNGQHSWYSRFFGEFAGATLPRFYQRNPKGSAADVKTKGVFNKLLTVEFSRKLNTNHKDDIDLNGKFFMKLIIK